MMVFSLRISTEQSGKTEIIDQSSVSLRGLPGRLVCATDGTSRFKEVMMSIG
jgi:hypothetical protein